MHRQLGRIQIVELIVLAQNHLPAFAAIHCAAAQPEASTARVGEFNHIVIVIQENHNLDNLYGQWGVVNGEPVNGLGKADPLHTSQIEQNRPAT
jgi:phospholipase C